MQIQKTETNNRSLSLLVTKKAKQGTFFQGNTTGEIPVPIFGTYQMADNYKKLHILQNQLAANGIKIYDTFIVNSYTRATYTELQAVDDGKFAIVYINFADANATNRMIVLIECLEAISYGSFCEELKRTKFAASFIQLFLKQYNVTDANTQKYLDNFATSFQYNEISNLGSQLDGDTISLNSNKNPNESLLNITSLPVGLELNAGTTIVHNIKHDDANVIYNFKML